MTLGRLHRATGRCACGQVSYRCQIESQTILCPCDLCRRNSGSAFQAWVNGRRASLDVVGETSCWASSEHATRHFCGACGSALFLFERDEPEVVEVATGTLDDPHGVVSMRVSRQYGDRWPEWARDVARFGSTHSGER